MGDPVRFTAETNIQKALESDKRVEQAIKALGLKCVDEHGEMCVAAEVETLREAALYHDIPLEKILAALNGMPPPGP